MSYPQPMTVVGGLGQYGHHAALHNAVTSSEIQSELRNRGYIPGAAPRHEEPHVPEPDVLTRPMAIAIAVDYSIEKYNIQLGRVGRPTIPHTSTHFFRCPSGSCYIETNTWNEVSRWAAGIATGYLNQQYAIPSWAQSMLHSGLRGLGSTGFALGGFSDWSQENPWFFGLIGNLFTAYGQHLTAKQVADAIKTNVPSDYLKREDLASILAALQQQGLVQPGQEQAVSAGVQQATAAPSWMMPVMIGGAALVAVLLLKK